jgi:uncharacterized protein involved in exopolysaccharide biosynthesis
MLHSDALQTASLGLPSGGSRPDDTESINFEAILRFLRKRHRLFVAWLFGGLLLGSGNSAVSPPSYTATAAVLLQDPTPRNTGGVAVAQSDAAHSTYVETQVQVFASDEVVGRIVDTLKLVDDPEFGRNAGGVRTWLINQVRPLLRSSQAPQREPRYATIVQVRRALSVHRVGMSDVLEIQFTSRDSARSAAFADAVIRSYAESRVAMQKSARAETATHIRELLAQLRDKAFPAMPPAEVAATEASPGGEARARFLEEQQKTDTYRTLYGTLLNRAVGEADAQFQPSNIQVISPPTPPLIARSQLIIIIAFSGLAGVLGLAHALLREATDDTLRTADDVRRSDGVGRVVVVPRLRSAELGPEPVSHFPVQRSYAAQCIPVYELMGKLAVALMEGSGRSERRMIGVTSSADGAGASLIAGQLARVIAETGRSTCLVDANWRLPAIDLPARPLGLNGEFARSTETLRFSDSTLGVMTLRSMIAVSDLVGCRSVISALEEVSASYDCIIVDLHSPFRTMDLEATIGRLDHIIVVVEARRSTAKALHEMLKVIPYLKRAAVVLNKAPDRQRGKAAGRVNKIPSSGRAYDTAASF